MYMYIYISVCVYIYIYICACVLSRICCCYHVPVCNHGPWRQVQPTPLKWRHITSLTIVYSTVYSSADQRKHQSSVSLALVRGIHRWPVISPHKWPVTRKKFPFDDVIMTPVNAHDITHQTSVRGIYYHRKFKLCIKDAILHNYAFRHS